MKLYATKEYKNKVIDLLDENDDIDIFESKKSLKFFGVNKKIFKAKRPSDGMLGAGMPDNEEVYKLLQNIAVFVINGMAWDTTKIVFKKLYVVFNDKRRRYIEIIDEFCEPGSCHIVKFLIPNNLEKEELDIVLDEAENIMSSLKNIRFYFNSKQIIFKYKKYWRIKIKK